MALGYNGKMLLVDLAASTWQVEEQPEEFYRRYLGGSGIGLTIAQALVKAHHGRIWAKSPGEGQGSAFHFSLPVS